MEKFNPFRLLRYLMQEERSLLDMQAFSGLDEAQNRAIIQQIEAAGWVVVERFWGGFKHFSVVAEFGRPVAVSEKLVTLSEYATLSGLHKTSIRDRIESGSIVTTRRKGVNGQVSVLIDVLRYPPAGARKKSRCPIASPPPTAPQNEE